MQEICETTWAGPDRTHERMNITANELIACCRAATTHGRVANYHAALDRHRDARRRGGESAVEPDAQAFGLCDAAERMLAAMVRREVIGEE